MQRCDLPEDAKSHWCETKVGALLEIAPNPHVVEKSRDVVASLAHSAAFGKQFAAHAWFLGFAAALLKFFIADGSSTNW